MKKHLILGTLLFTIIFSGCANKVHTYSPNTMNIMTLKDMKLGKVSVGNFTDSGREETKLMCRLATPVGTAKGETFASYVKDAFAQELMLSEHFSSDSKNIISANLDDLYGSTVLGNAYWKFNMTMKSSNGEQYKVESRYDYESSFSAMSACSEMQRSFVPAVQKLNKDIINNSNFSKLFK